MNKLSKQPLILFNEFQKWAIALPSLLSPQKVTLHFFKDTLLWVSKTKKGILYSRTYSYNDLSSLEGTIDKANTHFYLVFHQIHCETRLLDLSALPLIDRLIFLIKRPSFEKKCWSLFQRSLDKKGCFLNHNFFPTQHIEALIDILKDHPVQTVSFFYHTFVKNFHYNEKLSQDTIHIILIIFSEKNSWTLLITFNSTIRMQRFGDLRPNTNFNLIVQETMKSLKDSPEAPYQLHELGAHKSTFFQDPKIPTQRYQVDMDLVSFSPSLAPCDLLSIHIPSFKKRWVKMIGTYIFSRFLKASSLSLTFMALLFFFYTYSSPPLVNPREVDLMTYNQALLYSSFEKHHNRTDPLDLLKCLKPLGTFNLYAKQIDFDLFKKTMQLILVPPHSFKQENFAWLISGIKESVSIRFNTISDIKCSWTDLGILLRLTLDK